MSQSPIPAGPRPLLRDPQPPRSPRFRAGSTFVNLVIDYLTEHGTIEPGRIYDSPFTGVAPEGPEAIFPKDDLDEFFDIVRHLHDAALA